MGPCMESLLRVVQERHSLVLRKFALLVCGQLFRSLEKFDVMSNHDVEICYVSLDMKHAS